MNKRIKNIMLAWLILLIGCNMIIAEPVIKDGAIERFMKYPSFIIKYSNMIYKINDKNIVIPIFNGTMGDVYYDDFIKYCRSKKYLRDHETESDFIIFCKKGKVKKTFNEFLKFYKGNILKDVDIEHPAAIEVVDTNMLVLRYLFIVDGVTIEMAITVYVPDDFDRYIVKTVSDINVLKEDFGKYTPFFHFDIIIY